MKSKATKFSISKSASFILLLSSSILVAIEALTTICHNRLNRALADIIDESAEGQGLTQVTSIAQLSDIQPTDWAFQVLQNLAEKYNAQIDNQNNSLRENQPLSRYEFAQRLTIVLGDIEQQIASKDSNDLAPEDLAIIQKLQGDFAIELKTLGRQITQLENRIQTRAQKQFSPTTKLRAFSIFLVTDTFGNRANTTRAQNTQDETQLFLSYYSRLNLVSSFTGADILTASLTATNVPLLAASTGSQMANLITDPALNSGSNTLFLERLHYQFPLNDRLMVWLGIRTLQPFEFIPTINPVIASLDGPSSRFAWFNPAVYRPGFDGVGSGIAYKISQELQLHLAYLVAGSSASNPGVGFFRSNSVLISQLTITPNPQVTAALTYAHKYFRPGTANLFGATGSTFALQPFEGNATISDNFGLEFNWRISKSFRVGGWFGYTQAYSLETDLIGATIINGALNLTILDLFKSGNHGGFIVGIPPKVISNNYVMAGMRREDLDTSLHLEVFYTYRLNDNISITPNLYVITQPNHNANNGPIWVGVIRTNFTF